MEIASYVVWAAFCKFKTYLLEASRFEKAVLIQLKFIYKSLTIVRNLPIDAWIHISRYMSTSEILVLSLVSREMKETVYSIPMRWSKLSVTHSIPNTVPNIHSHIGLERYSFVPHNEKIQNLRELNIQHPLSFDILYKLVRSFRNVEKLEIMNVRASQAFQYFSNWTTLREIKIVSVGNFTDLLLRDITRIPNLRSLTLQSIPHITYAGFDNIIAMNTLIRLEISYCWNLGEALFTRLPSLTNLVDLSLTGQYISDGELMDMCTRMKLTDLRINHCPAITPAITEEVLKVLTCSIRNIVINAVVLKKSGIGSERVPRAVYRGKKMIIQNVH
jgi:hypothetical protein